ncbi:MAG: 2,3-bisphosphoglycerate-independent phosphoglycerate mutase, partial [Prochlorothrix sp.]
SEWGVHSHLNHLFSLLTLAKEQSLTDVCLHVVTDGRDTNPQDGIQVVEQIQNRLDQEGIGRISTLAGRYYSMDRDRRWDRVEKAYRVMTTDGEGTGQTALEAVKASYEAGITDEFIEPVRLAPGAVEAGDGVIFFNFRPDRARQLTYAFVDPNFDGFNRPFLEPLAFTTFTQYDGSLSVDVAFPPQNLTNILGQVIADQGLKQFRTAETEKYPHVTYFFNGGIEEPFAGEDRELVSSPMVATYDKAPTMSADQVTDVAVNALKKRTYSLVVMNYANPDMVGHTGQVEATVTAIETVDRCIGRLLEAISQAGGTAIITADHGNAEYMRDEAGNPWTAHTTNPVPLILVEGEGAKIVGHGTEVQLREGGCLADIAPTILEILQLEQPAEMTGQSLIAPARVPEPIPQRVPVSLSV